jgi:DTW domain-containing protein YfiP
MSLSTRIVILMHHREVPRTTSTARLATLALPHCETRVRGLRDTPLSTEGLLHPDRQALLLFPTPDARELTPEYAAALRKPVTLLVPDGTWGQAAKVAKREPSLREVPRVKVTSAGPSRYHLRQGTRPGGLATIEAIAQALGVLEGEDVRRRLEAVFLLMVSRTLATRGNRRLQSPSGMAGSPPCPD